MVKNGFKRIRKTVMISKNRKSNIPQLLFALNKYLFEDRYGRETYKKPSKRKSVFMMTKHEIGPENG